MDLRIESSNVIPVIDRQPGPGSTWFHVDPLDRPHLSADELATCCVEPGQEESCWGRVCYFFSSLLCAVCGWIDWAVGYLFANNTLIDNPALEILLEESLEDLPFVSPFTLLLERITSFLKDDVQKNLQFPCEIRTFIRIYPDCRSSKRYTFEKSASFEENSRELFAADFYIYLNTIEQTLQAHNICFDSEKTKIGIVIAASQGSLLAGKDLLFVDGTFVPDGTYSGALVKERASPEESLALLEHHLRLIDQPLTLSKSFKQIKQAPEER